jgi:hypothetical protein
MVNYHFPMVKANIPTIHHGKSIYRSKSQFHHGKQQFPIKWDIVFVRDGPSPPLNQKRTQIAPLFQPDKLSLQQEISGLNRSA